MALLPAQIPEIPESRSGVVAARLARKIGPLFGVAWDDGPFGQHTWVSDYSRITLSEIARGAPLPARARATAPAAEPTWLLVDRVGVAGQGAGMPREIANATLNRFGPDTKAAVLLTGVNRLLAPVGEAIDTVIGLLADRDGAPVSAELRLVAWTVLVIEAFRSQPALVAAGISARTIQRELVRDWQLPAGQRLSGVPLTRCEISAADHSASPVQPCDLEFVDTTFSGLQLDGTAGPALAGRLRHDEIVDRLLRRLRAAGTAQEASHLWLSQRRAGEVVVEALVPPTALARDFVTEFAPADPTTVPALPVPPAPERFAALPALTRRALLIALLGVLRHVQSFPARREASRTAVVADLARIADLARGHLEPQDPVRLVAECRTALMTVQTLRHNTEHDLSAVLPRLLAATDACAAARRAGRLDRGAAAEIIGAANIEVNVVRRSNATDPAGRLPAPDALDGWLRRSWRNYLEALEVDLAAVDADPARLGLLGYHLHNYAAFLAGHPDSDADLRTAIRLFGDLVLPARELLNAHGGGFQTLRHSLQIASRAACGLAAAAVAAGDETTARTLAATGLGWVRRAIDDQETSELLATPTEPACRFALGVAPALLLAVELEVDGAGEDDIDAAEELVRLARRWEDTSVGGRPEAHARHHEVIELERRIDKLRKPAD